MAERIRINIPWKIFLKGFAITFLTALFVGVGVYLILFIMGALPISRDTLVFLTVLLYALAFGIAKAGMNLKPDFYPFSRRRDDVDYTDMRKASGGRRPYIFKILAFIWLATGVCAVFWLTPAFIIFWYSLQYPREAIMLSSFILSLSAIILYYFLNEDIIAAVKDCFSLFIGGSAGVIIAVFVIYHFMGNRIFVTWE